MRDQNGGQAELALQALDFDLHIQPQILIQRGEGFIQQKDARLHGQGTRQRDALLLTAR